MKKLLALVTAASLLASTALAAPPKATDVGEHWAKGVIEKWIDNGKISGYADGTIKPDGNITRAEFATMLCSVLPKWGVAEEVPMEFADVAKADWFYSSIQTLLNREVIAKADNFMPNSSITREDAMTMLGRAYYVGADEDNSALKMADAKDISAYAVEYISGLIGKGAIKGYPDNTIQPKAKITRAESMQLINGMANLPATGTLAFTMAQIYAGVKTQMPAIGNIEITSDNSEYYLGIKNMKFVEAIASEAMTGSQAHSVCLVRVEDGSDVAAIKEQIRTSVNPRKWVCVGVEREDVIVVNQGNLILLVVDQFAPKEIAESFMKAEIATPPAVEEDSKLKFIDGQYVESIGELRPQSVENFAKKVDSISAKYLKDSKNIFYAMVPSKNYYIADKIEPKFDYAQMDKILTDNIKSAKKINLTDCLTYDDYYKTDFHWKQENLQKTLNRLGENLGFTVDLAKYTQNRVENFIGQYGVGKEDFPSETLRYLSNERTDRAVVTNAEKPNAKSVYDTTMLDTFSPYDVFLSGSSPLITIENKEINTNRELIIFRDSFTSGIAPMLIDSYSKITLIDIRYIMSGALAQFVDFKGQDVLFLYNDQIINNSEMLK